MKPNGRDQRKNEKTEESTPQKIDKLKSIIRNKVSFKRMQNND